MSTLQKLKLPLILLGVLIFPLLLGSYVPTEIKSFSYALSLSMKAILIFVLPVIVFSFVFSCLVRLQSGAFTFVIMLIGCVFVSNITAIMTGYTVGYTVFSFFPVTAADVDLSIQLQPMWQFSLPPLVSNETALMVGFILGLLFSIRPNETINKKSEILNHYAHLFLQKGFVPVLPLFILGFVFKLEHDQVLSIALNIYGPIFCLIISTQMLYLSLLYMIASNFSLRQFLTYLRNVAPASLTGFTTISSAASMPVLIMSTEKNLPDEPERADMIVPAVVNIHTLGSAIGASMLALATLLTFGMPLPSVHVFVVFAFYFALAKYAVAAVPGGVILVLTPILQSHLGFTHEMIGLITAVYLILDPFGTTMNVTGNGVFPILFNKLFNRVQGKKSRSVESQQP